MAPALWGLGGGEGPGPRSLGSERFTKYALFFGPAVNCFTFGQKNDSRAQENRRRGLNFGRVG